MSEEWAAIKTACSFAALVLHVPPLLAPNRRSTFARPLTQSALLRSIPSSFSALANRQIRPLPEHSPDDTICSIPFWRIIMLRFVRITKLAVIGLGLSASAAFAAAPEAVASACCALGACAGSISAAAKRKASTEPCWGGAPKVCHPFK